MTMALSGKTLSKYGQWLYVISWYTSWNIYCFDFL